MDMPLIIEPQCKEDLSLLSTSMSDGQRPRIRRKEQQV